MAFITEKEELKPGPILFRRGGADHRMWYCRMKMPKGGRYKTVSLKTTDKEAARVAKHLVAKVDHPPNSGPHVADGYAGRFIRADLQARFVY